MSKPVFTDQQIADQITRDGMHWRGDNYDNVIRYSFSSSLGYWWDNTSEFALDAVQQLWIRRALNELEDLFDLDFQEVGEPANTESAPPFDIIQFANDTGTGTYSSSYTYGNGDIVFNAVVFDQNWSSNQSANLEYGSYGYLTILHEILHSLGLEHPGEYNAGSGSGPITYANSAEFAQDTHRFTVMSYFRAQDDGSGAVHYDTVQNRWVYASTPMVYDILAMTSGSFAGAFDGYAANSTTRQTDTVYGYETSNLNNDAYDFDVNTAPVVTLYDTGGIDTLNLSGDIVDRARVVNYDSQGNVSSYSTITRTETLIDLREGGYSSTHGMTFNIGIAFDTVIENAVGTMFNDTIFGNDAANTVWGASGQDVFHGGAGNDRFYGGADNDTMVFAVNTAAVTMVRFGQDVLIFNNTSGEKDWAVEVEAFEMVDMTISLSALQSNDVYSYLASNVDLINAFGANTSAAVKHYYDFGYTRDRTLDSFDEWSYLASHTDLIMAYGSNGALATMHYAVFGYQKGRASDSFDEWAYLASNDDLINVFRNDIGNAAKHYAVFGYNAGRQVDDFNAVQYLDNYADLRAAYGDDLDAASRHYVLFGYNAGRTDEDFFA